MHFDCRLLYDPQPSNPNDYLRNISVDVMCLIDNDNEDGKTALAARLVVDHLDILRAEHGGESIACVCDAESDEWVDVWEAVFEPRTNELRSDLGFDEPMYDLLFLKDCVFHPALRKWQAYIVWHIANLVPMNSVLVMRKNTRDLTDRELAKLGFMAIADSDFLIRLNMAKHKYDATKDKRDAFSAVVPVDAGDFVNGLLVPEKFWW